MNTRLYDTQSVFRVQDVRSKTADVSLEEKCIPTHSYVRFKYGNLKVGKPLPLYVLSNPLDAIVTRPVKAIEELGLPKNRTIRLSTEDAEIELKPVCVETRIQELIEINKTMKEARVLLKTYSPAILHYLQSEAIDRPSIVLSREAQVLFDYQVRKKMEALGQPLLGEITKYDGLPIQVIETPAFVVRLEELLEKDSEHA